MLQPKRNQALYHHYQLESLCNVQRHTLSLLQESNDVLERSGVWTKLCKTLLLARGILGNSRKEYGIPSDSQMRQDGIETEVEKVNYELGQLSKSHNRQFDLVQMRWEKETLGTLTVTKMIGDLDFYGAPWEYDINKYVMHGAVGSTGTFPLKFKGPSQIAVHPATELIYVLERGNHRIQVLNKDLSFYRMFGKLSSDNFSYNPDEFRNPTCLAISREGLIAVGELRSKIRIYNSQFDLVCIIEKGQKRSATSKSPTDGPAISNPLDMCFDRDGNLYVANIGGHNVLQFNRNFEYEWSFTQEIDGRKYPQEIFPEAICRVEPDHIGVYYRAVNSVYIYDQNGTHVRCVNLKDNNLHCCLSYPAIHGGPGNTILFCDINMPGIFLYDGNSQDVVELSKGSREISSLEFKNKAKSQLAESTKVRHFCFGPDQRIYIIDERGCIKVFGPPLKSSQ